jgi:hypothetical protein
MLREKTTPEYDPASDYVAEPQGLSEWRLHQEIEAYVRKLRANRSNSPRGRSMSEREELRALFNQLLWPYGFRVTSIPVRVW